MLWPTSRVCVLQHRGVQGIPLRAEPLPGWADQEATRRRCLRGVPTEGYPGERAHLPEASGRVRHEVKVAAAPGPQVVQDQRRVRTGADAERAVQQRTRVQGHAQGLRRGALRCDTCTHKEGKREDVFMWPPSEWVPPDRKQVHAWRLRHRLSGRRSGVANFMGCFESVMSVPGCEFQQRVTELAP